MKLYTVKTHSNISSVQTKSVVDAGDDRDGINILNQQLLTQNCPVADDISTRATCSIN